MRIRNLKNYLEFLRSITERNALRRGDRALLHLQDKETK